ncbi:LLM class flavin-dependent oxidoreductase [Pseudomonas sp. RIT623]|uniref:LLM class flavin-dependent oxidoreductase n=1 Tax=Pseudomonas sp. RIT623 TaxID=2559075 RepID=UPI00106F0E83|nr:LLM class flavin-dependent oxidoreductase [Pseudomonas sp. RIT623]TFF42586.1 LLM class flavin-dependent oxidoreductase [Pseudomonas sp. RIT623]
MKISYFQQVPYRSLPDDFESRHESVVTTPYHDLVTPEGIRSAFKDALDEMMFAARCGFDGIAITEHGQSSYDMMPNPDLFQSVVAYMTEQEGLETAIYPLGRSLGKTREPLRVAEEQAMLDCMSGGRLICGFPIGLAYDANSNNGVAPMETRERFDENLELILRAWREREPFAFNGKFTKLSKVNIWPRPLQTAPHPPVWITAIGNPNTMKFILENNYGFNYFGWFGPKVTGRRIFDRFQQIAEELGKEVNPYQVGFMQMVAVAETDAEAERLYARHAEYFFRKSLGGIGMNRLALPGGIDIRGLEFIYRDPKDFGIYEKMRTITFKELVECGAIICGSPSTVRERIKEFASDFKIGNLHAMLQFGSMPTELAKYNIELFAREVKPHLSQLWSDQGYQHHWWPERLGGKPA